MKQHLKKYGPCMFVFMLLTQGCPPGKEVYPEIYNFNLRRLSDSTECDTIYKLRTIWPVKTVLVDSVNKRYNALLFDPITDSTIYELSYAGRKDTFALAYSHKIVEGRDGYNVEYFNFRFHSSSITNYKLNYQPRNYYRDGFLSVYD